MQSGADYVLIRQGGTSLWISRQLEGDGNLELLSDPDRLFSLPQCEIVKDQRKIKVGRVPVALGGQMKGIYLKRYNAFSWRYRLGSIFRHSGAYRSWQGATLFLQAGFHVAPPLAAVEDRRWGMLKRSFYISEEIPESLTLGEFWERNASALTPKQSWRLLRSVIKEVAQLFLALHQKNIYHNDLKEANILISEKDGARKYYLTDLERVAVHRPLSRRRKVKNLVQIDRTLGRTFSRGRRLLFLLEYLGGGFKDKKERRKWIGKIVQVGRKADLHSLAKGQAGGLRNQES